MSTAYLSLEEDTKKNKPFGSVEHVRGRRGSGVRVRITPVTVSSRQPQLQFQQQQRGGRYRDEDEEFMLESALQPWSPGGSNHKINSFSNRDDSTSYNEEEGDGATASIPTPNAARQPMSLRRPSLLDGEDSASENDDMRTGGSFPHPNNSNYQIPNLMSWQSFLVKVGLFLLTMVAVYGAGIATGIYIRGTPSDAAPRISEVVSSSSNATTNGTTITTATAVPTLSPPSGVEAPSSPSSPASSTSSPTQPPTTIANNISSPTTTTPPNNTNTNSKNLLVGAYYYPWYGDNFHNGQGYLRSQLVPPQYPTLGEYDDTLPATIQQHLTWSRQANIGLWVTSWWGPDRNEDTTTRTVILPHSDLQDMKVALLYESTGRIKEEFNDTSFASNVEPDILHMCENYFDHPNYLKFNGRPVLFVYLTRVLTGQAKLEEVILTMRSAADSCGHSIYIVGDHAFDNSPDPSSVNLAFLYLDAVTNYDVYGSLKSDRVWNNTATRYAGPEAVDAYYQEQDLWRSRAWQYECNFIPSVSPGFNDRGVRLDADHHPLARELTENSGQGTLFAYGIALAKALVDPGASNLMLVNSFNEWHEDTQIEPTISTSMDANGGGTQFPIILTEGVEYAAYGELYLDILREGTIGRGNIFNVAR